MPPPARGRPYYDVERGLTMILPPGGGRAVPYVGARPGGDRSARRALERAGVVAAGEARTLGHTARRAGRRGGRVLARAGADPGTFLGAERTGLGGLLIYGFATIIGLALLDLMLSGRGPAGVDALLRGFGFGIQKLIDPRDPLVPAADAPAYAGAPARDPRQPPGRTLPPGAPGTSGTGGGLGAGGGILGAAGRIIGVPGVGTHSRAAAPHNWQSDNAIDVRVPVGTPVFAPATGRLGNTGLLPGVSVVERGRFAGQRVNLFGGGQGFYFAHLSRLAPGVREGAQVREGQLLGWTGEANGVPHLHFAVQNGSPFDYYRIRSGAAAPAAAR